MKKTENLIGGWAFLIGVVLAIVLGAIGTITPTLMWVLVLIGILVGFLNISAEETEPFLMSGTVLIIASALGQNVIGVSSLFNDILSSLLLIFVPSTIIVAIRNVFNLARR